MGLPKGRTNNPSGRKKSVPNKIGRSIKEQIKIFVDSKLLELPMIWEKLSPKEKSQLLTNLLPYLEAKLQAVAVQMELERLTDEQLEYVCNNLFNRNGNEKK